MQGRAWKRASWSLQLVGRAHRMQHLFPTPSWSELLSTKRHRRWDHPAPRTPHCTTHPAQLYGPPTALADDRMAMVVSPSVRPQVVAFSTPAGWDAFTDSLPGRGSQAREPCVRQQQNQQAASHNPPCSASMTAAACWLSTLLVLVLGACASRCSRLPTRYT